MILVIFHIPVEEWCRYVAEIVFMELMVIASFFRLNDVTICLDHVRGGTARRDYSTTGRGLGQTVPDAAPGGL